MVKRKTFATKALACLLTLALAASPLPAYALDGEDGASGGEAPAAVEGQEPHSPSEPAQQSPDPAASEGQPQPSAPSPSPQAPDPDGSEPEREPEAAESVGDATGSTDADSAGDEPSDPEGSASGEPDAGLGETESGAVSEGVGDAEVEESKTEGSKAESDKEDGSSEKPVERVVMRASRASYTIDYVGPEQGYTDAWGWLQLTREMHINGMLAFCCHHTNPTPELNSAVTSLGTVSNAMARKVLWYGYGGPASLGYDLVTTAMALSNAIGEDPNYYWAADAMLTDLESRSAPPASFVVTRWATSASGDQDLMTREYSPYGYIQITKASADASVSSAGSGYSFAGAEFGVYSDAACTNLVATLVTDAGGVAVSPVLNEGTYYVKETKAPEGFKLNSSVISVSVSGPYQTTYRTVEDEPITGRLQLVKTSANPDVTDGNACYSLAGAEYGLYRNASCTDLYAALVTDESGKASLSGIPLGTYYLKETKAPQGYALDRTVRTVTVTSAHEAAPLTVNVSDAPLNDPAAMWALKKDSETADGSPQGSARLEGAQFTVRYYDGLYDTVAQAEASGKPTRTWVVETAEDGYARLSEEFKVSGHSFYKDPSGKVIIPLGTLLIHESKEPEGYIISDEVYLRQVKDEGGVDAVVEYNAPEVPNDVIRADAKVVKTGTQKGGSVSHGSAVAIPLEGVEFSLYASKDYSENAGGSYTVASGATPAAVLVTDANGEASTEGQGARGALPFDTYLVVESRTPEGYIPAEPFELVVSEEGRTYEIAVDNERIASPVKVVKVDSETGETVALANTQFQILDAAKNVVMWPDGSADGILTTDSTGAFTTPCMLNYGTYYLREVAAPAGYVLGSSDIRFEVSEKRDWADPIVVEYADSPQKGSVTVFKVDAETGSVVSVPGAEFAIVAAEDIATPDGTLRASQGSVVATVATDADGKAMASGLYLGKYWVEETRAPEGYLLSGEKVPFELAFNEQAVSVVATLEFADVPQKGTVVVTKTDSETGEAVLAAGTTFQIVAAQDVVTPDGTVRAKAGDVVETIVTDDTGKASSGELYLGKYELVETVQPYGYRIETDPLPFELAYAEQAASVAMVLDFANDRAKGAVKVVKTEIDPETGEVTDIPVEGAVYGVFDSEGNKVAEVSTDAEGVAETPELALGTYTVYEIESPDGWALDPTPKTVDLVHDDLSVWTVMATLEFADAPTTLFMDKVAEQRDGSFLPFAETEWRVWAEDAAGETVFETVAVTDEEGSFTVSHLPHAEGLTYFVQETAVPEGYLLDGTVHSFTVDEDGLIEGESAYTVTAKNYLDREIEVHKVDSATGQPIEGAVFEVALWTGGGVPSEAGGEDAAGEWVPVAQAATGADGTALFDGLDFGWYRLAEIAQNPAYKAPVESGMPQTFYIECSASAGVNQVQVVENEPLTVETNVVKSTISKTSAGLVYRDGKGVEQSNVGIESYRYDVSFDNGSTDVFADEYWVVDSLEMASDALGLRVMSIALPVVENDTDGKVHVLYRTNLTDPAGGSAAGTSFAQPELHAGVTLNDGTARFDATGWEILGEFSATERTLLQASDFLSEGEHLTGLALCYGAVEVGFRSVEPLSYMVSASKALPEGTLIPNTATSHISRNWSATKIVPNGTVEQEPYGPHDDDTSSVVTEVVTTVWFDFSKDLGRWATGSMRLQGTGDAALPIAVALAASATLAAAALIILARRREEG